jgi:hypothetical protein
MMKFCNKKLLQFSLTLLALITPTVGYSYITLANGDQTLSNPQKWGPHEWGTGATITWSYMDDGVGSSLAGYTGTNTISALRSSIDTTYGSGSFNAAVNNAFATWAAAANLTFLHVADQGGNFAAATAPDIRIGAFAFTDPCCGGAGYGPPGNSAFPDALAGDLVLNNLASFQIYSYSEGQPYQPSDFANDLQGLLVHEIGHTLGLGHPESDGLQGSENDAIMCVLTTCDPYINLRRQLGSDDIAGIQFIYGAPAPVPLPAPFWLLGSGLVLLFGKRRKTLILTNQIGAIR